MVEQECSRPTGRFAAPIAPSVVGTVIALSPGMTEVLHRIHQYADASTPVVLVGETGTGKSFFARLLHQVSGRSGRFSDVTGGEIQERGEELGGFAWRFLEQCPADTGVRDGPTRFAADVVPMLEAGTYAGNVRDLRERVRAAYLLGRGNEELQVEHLPPCAHVSLRFEARADRAAQLRVVQWALWRTGDRVAKAAGLIGASRNTVSALRTELRGKLGAA